MKNNELNKELSFKVFLNESSSSWQRHDEYWKDSEYSYFEWQRYFRVKNEEIQRLTSKNSNFDHRDETMCLNYAHDKSKKYYIRANHKALVDNLKRKLSLSMDQYVYLIKNAELFYDYFKSNSFDVLDLRELTEAVDLPLIKQITKSNLF